MDQARDIVQNSDLTLLTMQLTVKDISAAKAMIRALKEHGVHGDRVMPLINRYYKRRAMISLDEAKKALGVVDIRCIDNDFKSAIKALNYGQPVSEAAPRSALHRDMKKLATEVFQARKAIAFA